MNFLCDITDLFCRVFLFIWSNPTKAGSLEFVLTESREPSEQKGASPPAIEQCHEDREQDRSLVRWGKVCR